MRETKTMIMQHEIFFIKSHIKSYIHGSMKVINDGLTLLQHSSPIVHGGDWDAL